MGLTTGGGPLAPERHGVFNAAVAISGRALYVEPWPRRVRGVFAGETLVDTRRGRLLHEAGALPQWYFPADDVRLDRLEETARRTSCPLKGEAVWLRLRGVERGVDDAWMIVEPPPLGPDLRGLVSFHFWALDEWWEEGERVLGHPRDPYHRVDALRTDRTIAISREGQVLARSTRPLVVYETGLVTRYYLPPEDVRTDLLEPSETETHCPYKGRASYWRLPQGDDLAWSYREPIPEAAALSGRIAFFDERVDVELDGELQPRPDTIWAR